MRTVRTVGAAEGCDLRVSDAPYLSNRHFALVVENGRVSVEDLGSMNGTEVFRPGLGWVKAWTPVSIQPGSKILAGRVLFKIGTDFRVDVVKDVTLLNRDSA